MQNLGFHLFSWPTNVRSGPSLVQLAAERWWYFLRHRRLRGEEPRWLQFASSTVEGLSSPVLTTSLGDGINNDVLETRRGIKEVESCAPSHSQRAELRQQWRCPHIWAAARDYRASHGPGEFPDLDSVLQVGWLSR